MGEINRKSSLKFVGNPSQSSPKAMPNAHARRETSIGLINKFNRLRIIASLTFLALHICSDHRLKFTLDFMSPRKSHFHIDKLHRQVTPFLANENTCKPLSFSFKIFRRKKSFEMLYRCNANGLFVRDDRKFKKKP